MNGTHSQSQLGLPFDFGVTECTWTDVAGEVEFTASLTPTGARLALVGPWPAAEEAGAVARPMARLRRGVLWRAEVNMADPYSTRIDSAPQGIGSRVGSGFSTRLPFPDCFTAPVAWAHWVGRREGIPVEGLLMAMRRTLVMVARHLERVQARQEPVAAAAV